MAIPYKRVKQATVNIMTVYLTIRDTVLKENRKETFASSNISIIPLTECDCRQAGSMAIQGGTYLETVHTESFLNQPKIFVADSKRQFASGPERDKTTLGSASVKVVCVQTTRALRGDRKWTSKTLTQISGRRPP